MERLPNTTLQSYLAQNRSLPIHLSMRLFAQLVDAVEHMHKHHVSHSDLKTENISYDPAKNTIKLFDFGLSERVCPEQPISHNCAGSPLYMAPEVYKPECHNPLVSDMWSLGIILYELLTGETPFSHCESLQELKDVLSNENPIIIPPFISQEVRELLSKVLSFDPSMRPTALELRSVVDNLRNSREVVETSSQSNPPNEEVSVLADDSPKVTPPMSPRSRERILNEADDDDFGESEDSDGLCSSSA